MQNKSPELYNFANSSHIRLKEVRDSMTNMQPDREVEVAMENLIENWREDPENSTPMQDLRAIVEMLRLRDRGDYRIIGMNSLVRILGQPDRLALFLDMMRQAVHREGTKEQEIARMSQSGKWHSIYGWSGTTFVTLSSPEQTGSTCKPNDKTLSEKLEYPQALWWISIHVWQPNQNAVGFQSGKRCEPSILLEPPHSHPFDFVSMVTKGEVRQSIYRPREIGYSATGERYSGVTLNEVDGIWPPHEKERRVALQTVEDRVPLTAGQSYFLPYNLIHDFEIDKEPAHHTPAITLFMASESLDVAKVYMADSMLTYHKQNPKTLVKARPMPPSDWEKKLEMLSSYLRGESKTLRLSAFVRSESSYAFLHV